jgi:hypothetical protein
MKNINYFAYATFILTIALVYLFGELKHQKTISKTKELWLLEDTSELEDRIDGLEATISILAKQNKEYEIMFAIIKLKIDQDKEVKEEPKEEVKPSQQSTIPKLNPNYPGRYIPKGQPSPNDGKLII